MIHIYTEYTSSFDLAERKRKCPDTNHDTPGDGSNLAQVRNTLLNKKERG